MLSSKFDEDISKQMRLLDDVRLTFKRNEDLVVAVNVNVSKVQTMDELNKSSSPSTVDSSKSQFTSVLVDNNPQELSIKVDMKPFGLMWSAEEKTCHSSEAVVDQSASNCMAVPSASETLNAEQATMTQQTMSQTTIPIQNIQQIFSVVALPIFINTNNGQRVSAQLIQGYVDQTTQQSMGLPPSIPCNNVNQGQTININPETKFEIKYVNPKQFCRILKRRDERIRLASRFKILKRNRYMHESRHLHAIRRSRRPHTGRFTSFSSSSVQNVTNKATEPLISINK